MSPANFFIMRHELLLTAAALLVLLAEIFWNPQRKQSVNLFAIILFSLITVIGFLPSPGGSLFGGMYESSGTRLIMKNILNIGALLVLIQSVTWLNKEENSEKISEYYILLITTLIGMNFMISAGHFLMFYLGLELATIPIAALAAYDRYSNKSAEAGIKLILISALSSGVLLYGLSMIYGTTGTFYFNEIAKIFVNDNLQILGFIFFFAGMAFKISIVPFHLWTADVYEGAPVSITSYLSVISKGAAIFIFIIVLFTQVLSSRTNFKWIIRVLVGIIIALFALHTLGLAIRWYVAGHAPWSNGYETMIYISWGTVLSGLLFSRNSKITLATTAILASVTLMVANLSWLDPQVTNLVPVLKSYWLVIHVAIITASYSFLGVGALLGFLNLILIGLQNKNNFSRLKGTIEELTNINEMNLIIGVFLVTIGTFLGAVWANESWGRYWGWDPKETWALVTVLVYSFIIHMRLIPGMNGVYGFNFAALIGFSSVLMTYFGVNYYLSGMHSYAAGDPVPVPTFVYYTVAIVFLVSLQSYINHLRMNKISKL